MLPTKMSPWPGCAGARGQQGEGVERISGGRFGRACGAVLHARVRARVRLSAHLDALARRRDLAAVAVVQQRAAREGDDIVPPLVVVTLPIVLEAAPAVDEEVALAAVEGAAVVVIHGAKAVVIRDYEVVAQNVVRLGRRHEARGRIGDERRVTVPRAAR
jgi:hypothetical protein